MKKESITKFIDISIIIFFIVGIILGVCSTLGLYWIYDYYTFYSIIFYIILDVYPIYILFSMKYNNFIINILDCILCFILTNLSFAAITYKLYTNMKLIYFVLCGIFIFLPFIFSYVNNEKNDFQKIIKVITRAILVAFIFVIILMMQSCTNNGIGI